MDKHYQNLIFTNHALDRIKLRTISQDQVQQVLSQPDKTFSNDKPDQIKFIRSLNNRTIHVVAKKLPDQKKWLILSVWVRGEDDPIPFMWKIITFPFKIIAKTASIILSYMKKTTLEKKKL